MSDHQARKYLVTINNPHEKGYDHETIKVILASIKPNYWCLADEIGEQGTFHTHIFIYRSGAIRSSTMRRKFPGGHIDSAEGSCQENRAYVAKSGKWSDSHKAETSIAGSFEEFGDIPDERAERSPAASNLIESLEAGKSISDIIRGNPNYIFRSNDISVLRQTLLADRYMTEQRDVIVSYLFGPTGCGKTRSIFDTHNAAELFRITDYGASNGIRFDGYQGQSTLVFEEYNSQIPITSMLNYLDRYPVYLPARYTDRIACYTEVFITSNLPLYEQYRSVQIHKPEVWAAFLRRLSHIIEFMPDGSTVEHSTDEYK